MLFFYDLSHWLISVNMKNFEKNTHVCCSHQSTECDILLRISHQPFLTIHVWFMYCLIHYSDIIMGMMASQITSPTIVNSTVYLGADQRKQQSSVSLAFVQGTHRWPVNSPHKGPVTQKMFPFDDVIISYSTDNITVNILLWISHQPFLI